jgi:hypothetical protein
MPVHRGADIVYIGAATVSLGNAARVDPAAPEVGQILNKYVKPALVAEHAAENDCTSHTIYAGQVAAAAGALAVPYRAFIATGGAPSYRYVIYDPTDHSVLIGPSHPGNAPHD